MTIKFSINVGIYKEAQNQKKNIDKSGPVCKLHSKMQLLGVLASLNSAGLSILTSEMNLENFRTISQRLAILEKRL